jgi:N-methylhydantoinase A
MAQENVAVMDIRQRYFADVCYVGQGYHLEVPFELDSPDPLAALTAAFYAAHDRTYGYAPKAPIRLVNLRTVHSVASTAHLQDEWTAAAGPALVRTARILLPERRAAVEAAVYSRASLKVGDAFAGPAIIEQDDTTTLLAPGWHCRVDALGNLVLERQPTDRTRT